MLTKLNFLQSKYYFLLIAILAIFVQPVSAAKSCDYRVFNIKTAEKVASLELLTQIADSCNFSIIIKDNFASEQLKKELHGVNIKELSLTEIFEVLIGDNDLYYEYNKNFLKISALKTKTFKIDYITSVREGTAILNASVDANPQKEGSKRDLGTDNTITSNDTFDFWKTMLEEINSLLNTGSDNYKTSSPIVNSNAGLVTVTGTKKQLERVEKYINNLEESLHKQVLIDVSILAVTMEKGKDRGVNWSKLDLSLNSLSNVNSQESWFDKPSSLLNGSIISNASFSMDGLLRFLDTNGDTKVVSSPKVLAMNNQQALITLGDNINYRIKTTENSTDATGTVAETYDNFSIFIGILLNITPEISKDNEIILRINPSISAFKNPEEDKPQATGIIREIAPDTTERKLSTVVKVKNGNTIILGGLISSVSDTDNSSVPILGSIPIIKGLFSHSGESKRVEELVFVITPRIIGPRDNTKATLKDLGFSKKIYEQ